jgi:CheY-like chemotaxis protein
MILVVEDDPDIRSLVADLLAAEGYRVRTAADGREALDRAREKAPLAIVLDLMMPGMDGFQFLERAAHDPVLARIPVIVATASMERSVEGATEFLTKPFSAQCLLDKVATSMRAPGQATAHATGQAAPLEARAG